MLPATCVTSAALCTICCYSPLGSAVGLTRQAGELVAVAFPTPKTGYKNPMAYGAKPTFTSEVTTKYFVKKVRAAAESTCEDKKLMPYHPNAPRNRPRQTVSNAGIDENTKLRQLPHAVPSSMLHGPCRMPGADGKMRRVSLHGALFQDSLIARDQSWRANNDVRL